MNRTQFTFYESFFRSISRIKKASDRAAAYDAICAYALYEQEPDLDGMPDAAAVAFEVAKPNLDASRRKASAGKKGGEAKQTEANRKQVEASDKQTEANRKQTGSKAQARGRGNQVKEQDKEQDKDKEQMLKPPTPLQGASPSLQDAFGEWLRYKQERREGYKPAGLQALQTEVMNNARVYGDEAVAQLIRTCMASNWKGIIFDRLATGNRQGFGKAAPAPQAPARVDSTDMDRMLKDLEIVAGWTPQTN